MNPQHSHLLSALSPDIQHRIFEHLELVPQKLGDVLYESGDTLCNVYFPIDCIISLLYIMEDGSSAEISVVGNEGVVGVSLFMSGESTISRAKVPAPPTVCRVN